jgi:hypothetical protein
MCNAWNHSPSCGCGWGGKGHIGRSHGGYNGYRGNLSFQIPRYELRSYSIFSKPFPYHSYVNPNAHCPVCGASVFFYQSPYGGRVFFDELGPPWPKHPCTDSSLYSSQSRSPFNSSSIKRLDVTRLPVGEHKEFAHWKRDVWSPLVCEEIRETPSSHARLLARVIYIQNGYKMESPLLTVYTSPSPCSLGDRPLFIRKHPKYRGKYEISSFSVGSDDLSVEPISLVASILSFYDLNRIIKGGRESTSGKARLIKKKDIPASLKSNKYYPNTNKLTAGKRTPSKTKNRSFQAGRQKSKAQEKLQDGIYQEIHNVEELAEALTKKWKG